MKIIYEFDSWEEKEEHEQERGEEAQRLKDAQTSYKRTQHFLECVNDIEEVMKRLLEALKPEEQTVEEVRASVEEFLDDLEFQLQEARAVPYE